MFQGLFYIYFMFISILGKAKTDVAENEIRPRVINGWPGKLGDVPYQVAFKAQLPGSRFRKIYTTFCGGTILTPRKLLTAAHCFVDKPRFCQKIFGNSGVTKSLFRKYAVAGNIRNRDTVTIWDSAKNGQWRLLHNVTYPAKYNFPKDDIAIVFTRKPFVFTSTVNSIPYAVMNVDYHGKCLVSGFGRTGAKMTASVLMLAHLTLIPKWRCNTIFRMNMQKFICTSSAVTDVGQGDSGGPLVCMNTSDPNEIPGKGVLVGVVSGNRRRSCSFFTRVSSFYRYIQRNRSCHLRNHNMFYLIVIQTSFLLF